MNPESEGTLVLVATPIGNLEDLAPRALSTLREADIVYAEDTRSFGKLRARFEIATPCRSLFEHNERQRLAEVLDRVRAGEKVALVSEAGTPTINDPGFLIVRACRREGLAVSTIPGPCAAIAALSISGFESNRFAFEGFLPVKSGKKERALREYLERPFTTICYESPHRILKTLRTMRGLSPRGEIFLARELTKRHEETLRGTTEEILGHFERHPERVKGEFVVIIGPTPEKAARTEHPEMTQRAGS